MTDREYFCGLNDSALTEANLLKWAESQLSMDDLHDFDELLKRSNDLAGIADWLERHARPRNTQEESDRLDIGDNPAEARKAASRVDLAIAREMLLARRNGSLFVAFALAALIAAIGWNRWFFLLPATIGLKAAVAQANIWFVRAELKRRSSERREYANVGESNTGYRPADP